MTLLNNSSVVYWDLLEGWKYRRIRRAAIDGGCCVTALDRKGGSLELTCHCRVHQSDWLHQWQITRLIIEGRWCLPKLRTSQFTLQNLFISCRTITIRNFIQWIWHWTKWWPRSEHGRRKKRKMMMATRCDLCDSWSMGHDDDFHHSAPGLIRLNQLNQSLLYWNAKSLLLLVSRKLISCWHSTKHSSIRVRALAFLTQRVWC